MVKGGSTFLHFAMTCGQRVWKRHPVGGLTGEGTSQEELSFSFLYLLLAQGFFSGLTIGKLAEGSIKAGIKHSFALMMMSFLVSAVANLIFG